MDPLDKMTAKWQPTALSLFRFITGLSAVSVWRRQAVQISGAVPMFAKVGPYSLYGAAGTLELVLGGLLLIGLFTRIVAFILAGEMAFAYFLGHMFRSRGTGLPAAHQWRHARDPVLLRLSLSGDRGRRAVQRRRDARRSSVTVSSIIASERSKRIRALRVTQSRTDCARALSASARHLHLERHRRVVFRIVQHQRGPARCARAVPRSGAVTKS